MARAIVETLERHNWHAASVILEDEHVSDGFLQAFRKHTSSTDWHIEDEIVLSKKNSNEFIDYKLHALLENKSRVIILHCSGQLATKVFQVAEQNGFIKEGYAWFVTEDVGRDSKYEQSYPIGLVMFRLNRAFDYLQVFNDVVNLVTRAMGQYVALEGRDLMEYANRKNCSAIPTEEEYEATRKFYE